MAPRTSSMAPPAKKQKTSTPASVVISKPKDKADALYYKCLAQKVEGEDFTVRNFTVKELLELGVTDDQDELMELGQILVDRYKFVALVHHNSILYRCRSTEIALQLVQSSIEAVMCYQQIESSGDSGCWKRILMMRTNLHENTVGKAVKELLKRGIIKDIKSARWPTRKMFMMSYLTPSEENQGGIFYHEGELDQGLIETLGKVIVAKLDELSWAKQEGHPKHPKLKSHKRESLKRKRGEDHDATVTIEAPTTEDDKEVDTPIFRTPENRDGIPLIPLNAQHEKYPDAASLVQIINDGDFLYDKKLTREDVQQLLHKLENDGLVERMRKPGTAHELTLNYRSVRKSWDRKTGTQDWYGPVEPGLDGIGPGNGLTQSPCGRCPVFKQCRPGGIVSPETCVYMEEWLKF